MGDLSRYLKERYSKNTSDTKDIMTRQRVKNSIVKICENNLVESGDTLVFEALPRELPYAVSVITDDYIKSRYIVNQISETLFTATLREVDLGL